MKTTVDLPDELVRRIKVRAAQEGKPLKELVADLLSQALKAGVASAQPGGAAAPEHLALNERGLPVVRCGPNAPATRMSAEELIAREQQSLSEEEVRRASVSV